MEARDRDGYVVKVGMVVQHHTYGCTPDDGWVVTDVNSNGTVNLRKGGYGGAVRYRFRVESGNLIAS